MLAADDSQLSSSLIQWRTSTKSSNPKLGLVINWAWAFLGPHPLQDNPSRLITQFPAATIPEDLARQMFTCPSFLGSRIPWGGVSLRGAKKLCMLVWLCATTAHYKPYHSCTVSAARLSKGTCAEIERNPSQQISTFGINTVSCESSFAEAGDLETGATW